MPEQKENAAYEMVLRKIKEARETGALGLDLSGLGLTNIPESLLDLPELQELNLNRNQISIIPDYISQLTQLRRLRLVNNRITIIPDSIAQFTQLQTLSLGANQIASIPDSIAQLTVIQEIYLQENQIGFIPDAITRLTQLRILELSGNRLAAVPEGLTHLPELQALYLHDNPGLRVPDDILGPRYSEVVLTGRAPKSPKEILAYVSQLSDSRPLNEAKLILVGQGNVGKTSLVRSLTTGKFKKGEKSTEGIKIDDWQCLINKNERVTVHIWDFGGQEMMHATHQFFLTQRSLYLLVLNRRQGGIDREADYWFRLIREFGGKDAPVIVVLNKQKDEPFDVNRGGWLEKYADNIKGFVATDCTDRRSVATLKRRITEELNSLASLKARFPQRWFAVKDELSLMQKDHISFEAYRALCQKHGEADPERQTSLASFLHDLGIALNYGQDPRLRFNYVLKPEWVTQGIYALLHAFVRSKGIFTPSEAEHELAKKKYSPEDTHFILSLMERFELSFPLGDRQNRVLIPELLDDQQPKETSTFNPSECLNFGYKYTVLPEGLLPRFIARTHHLGRLETRWKSGVILVDETSGCQALVRADGPEGEVRIHVSGPPEVRRELLAIIRYNFEVIHSDFESKPEAQVYLQASPQKAVPLEELEVRAKNMETMLSVMLPDKTIVSENIASLLEPVASTPSPLKVFLSYSHTEENALSGHLKTGQRNWPRTGLFYSTA